VVLGVVKDGVLVLSLTRGLASLEHAIPLSPRSVLPLASESKPFTAAAILHASRAGALALDDDVRTHIPELPDLGHRVTIDHLLRHTSGVRDYPTLWELAGESAAGAHTPASALALLARQRALNFPPGSEFLYSNSGYFLLAVVLERATGRSLAEYAQEHLFAPLGMESTRYVDDPTVPIPHRADGHIRRPDGSIGRTLSASAVIGAGGVWTTVEDLAKWERAFHDDAIGGSGASGGSGSGAPAAGGDGDGDGEERAASGSLRAAMIAPDRLADGREIPYARGLVPGDFDGLAHWSHGGKGDGSSTFILRFPALRFSVIVLSNDIATNAPSIAWRSAIPLLFGPYREETLARMTPAPAPAFVELDEAELAARVGAYRDPNTRALWVIARAPGGLVLDGGAGRSLLRPLGAGRFRTPGPGQEIAVEFEGAAMRVDIEGQPERELARVERIELAPEALAEYAGTYESEELEVPWTLGVRDGALRFVGEGAPEAALTPTIKDEFALGAVLRVSFRRDEGGRIVALAAHTERVWAQVFAREGE